MTHFRDHPAHSRGILDFGRFTNAAQAEATGVREVLSFDHALDRVGTITRREP